MAFSAKVRNKFVLQRIHPSLLNYTKHICLRDKAHLRSTMSWSRRHGSNGDAEGVAAVCAIRNQYALPQNLEFGGHGGKREAGKIDLHGKNNSHHWLLQASGGLVYLAVVRGTSAWCVGGGSLSSTSIERHIFSGSPGLSSLIGTASCTL